MTSFMTPSKLSVIKFQTTTHFWGFWLFRSDGHWQEFRHIGDVGKFVDIRPAIWPPCSMFWSEILKINILDFQGAISDVFSIPMFSNRFHLNWSVFVMIIVVLFSPRKMKEWWKILNQLVYNQLWTTSVRIKRYLL